jgi:hypothetical protein
MISFSEEEENGKVRPSSSNNGLLVSLVTVIGLGCDLGRSLKMSLQIRDKINCKHTEMNSLESQQMFLNLVKRKPSHFHHPLTSIFCGLLQETLQSKEDPMEPVLEGLQ